MFSLPFARRGWDDQLLPVAFRQVCGGFFSPGHIIAGNLPWGLQVAGR